MKISLWSVVSLVILGMLSSACGPIVYTRAPGPDISGKLGPVKVRLFTILSAKVVPASLGYACSCGSMSVPPATLTFTVVVLDPDDVVDGVGVWIKVASTADGMGDPSSLRMDQLLALTKVSAADHVETWTGTSMDLAWRIQDLAGCSSSTYKVYWFANAWTSKLVILDPVGPGKAITDVSSLSLAPCKAPPVFVVGPGIPMVDPPLNATAIVHLELLPPGVVPTPVPSPVPTTVPTVARPKKPKEGGGAPSCSSDPNNPNCAP